jgi:hypothetical protein
MISAGERISTVSVPTILAAYNWPANSNRYQRVARFVDYLFGRVDRLQTPDFDRNWQTINLGATMPGLTRFPGAEEWLRTKGLKPQARL